MAMADSKVKVEVEVAVFMDTDLGTRFAIAVPPHITPAAFKREVERVHFNCFPKIGEIKVHAFMVKKKSQFYHLPDTLLVKFASSDSGLKGVRFLYVKARPSNEFNKPCVPEITPCIPIKNSNSTGSPEQRDYSSSTCKNKTRADGKKRTRKRLRRSECLSRPISRSVLTWNIRRKRKRTNRKRLLKCTKRIFDAEDLTRDAENLDGSNDITCCHCIPDYEVEAAKQRYVSSLVEGAPVSELSSEVMSVSSIIRSYFPNFDEVSSVVTNPSGCGITSRDTRNQPREYLKKNMVYDNNASPQFSTKRATNLLPFPLPMPCNGGSQKPERSKSKLGKRIVMASYHLGISPSRERPEISFCNSKGKKFQEFMSPSFAAKSSCFEISDSED